MHEFVACRHSKVAILAYKETSHNLRRMSVLTACLVRFTGALITFAGSDTCTRRRAQADAEARAKAEAGALARAMSWLQSRAGGWLGVAAGLGLGLAVYELLLRRGAGHLGAGRPNFWGRVRCEGFKSPGPACQKHQLPFTGAHPQLFIGGHCIGRMQSVGRLRRSLPQGV